jgi:flagellar protein FlaG
MQTALTPIEAGSPPLGAETAPRRAPRPHLDTAGEPSARVDRRELASAIAASGERVVTGGHTIEVSFNDEASRVVIKVKSQDSGEIVREIPPEDYRKFRARFREAIGLLFEETA